MEPGLIRQEYARATSELGMLVTNMARMDVRRRELENQVAILSHLVGLLPPPGATQAVVEPQQPDIPVLPQPPEPQ